MAKPDVASLAAAQLPRGAAPLPARCPGEERSKRREEGEEAAAAVT